MAEDFAADAVHTGAVPEAIARTAVAWYEFIQERHDEELRAEYPTEDSTPAVEKYVEQHRATQATHRKLVDAVHRGDQDASEGHLAELRDRASKWARHADHPEADTAAGSN